MNIERQIQKYLYIYVCIHSEICMESLFYKPYILRKHVQTHRVYMLCISSCALKTIYITQSFELLLPELSVHIQPTV